MTQEEAKYAGELADFLEHFDVCKVRCLFPDDAVVCAKALRAYAGQRRRRAVLALGFALVAAAGAGTSHLAMAAKAGVGMMSAG